MKRSGKVSKAKPVPAGRVLACPGCGERLALAVKAEHPNPSGLKPLSGGTVRWHPGTAPRIRCAACGHLTTYLIGSY